MKRIKFKNKSDQKIFLSLVISKLNSPSLRGLLQFGFKIKYSALKNYYSGIRLLPEDLFSDLCAISGIDSKIFDFTLLEKNWGQQLGGKKSKRSK